jgi:hypothetical protein
MTVWTRRVVLHGAHAVQRLSRPGRQRAFLDIGRAGLDVEHEPVNVRRDGRRRIVDHQSEALGIGRRAGPLERRIDPVAVAGIGLREDVLLKRLAADKHRPRRDRRALARLPAAGHSQGRHHRQEDRSVPPRGKPVRLPPLYWPGRLPPLYWPVRLPPRGWPVRLPPLCWPVRLPPPAAAAPGNPALA